jgi:hypothetical protein
MAKGEARGGYEPQQSGDVNSLAELARWVMQELRRISIAIGIGLAREVEFRNAAPAKPREGMITGADGVNWNPGSGKGVYAYYTGAWHFLG